MKVTVFLFVCSILLLMAGHTLRLMRWSSFIKSYEHPPAGALLRSMALGYALNFFVQFRLGELVRAYYSGKRMKNGVGFSLATVILDRFLDVLVVAALFAGQTFGKSEMLLYLAAFGWANMAKPWINLLWLILPLLHAKKNWRAPLKKWQFAAAALLLALGVNWLIEWYGGAFRYHYGTIGRMLDGVDQMPQLKFVLSNPLRFAAVLLGTLYENDFFIGQLGIFGNLDLPVGVINTTAGAMLLLGAVLGESRGPQSGLLRRAGAPVWCVVYLAGCMAAMYITYTPVGMIRVIGLQARYFLPVFLLAFWALAEALGLKVRHAAQNQNIALAVFAAYGALSGLLVFQHTFIGPVYTIG